MNDMIGYGRRNTSDNHLISSDYAAMYMVPLADGTPASGRRNEGRLSLVQQSTISYGHRVQPVFEAGSHELFWLHGQARGSMQAGRVVGNKGALSQVNHNAPNDDGVLRDLRKAVISQVDLKLAKGTNANSNSEGSSRATPNSDITSLHGCVLDSLQVSFNTAGLDVSETFSMQAALATKGRGDASILEQILS